MNAIWALLFFLPAAAGQIAQTSMIALPPNANLYGLYFLANVTAQVRLQLNKILAAANVTKSEVWSQLGNLSAQNGYQDAYNNYSNNFRAQAQQLHDLAVANLAGRGLDAYQELWAIHENESLTRSEECHQNGELLADLDPNLRFRIQALVPNSLPGPSVCLAMVYPPGVLSFMNAISLLELERFNNIAQCESCTKAEIKSQLREWAQNNSVEGKVANLLANYANVSALAYEEFRGVLAGQVLDAFNKIWNATSDDTLTRVQECQTVHSLQNGLQPPQLRSLLPPIPSTIPGPIPAKCMQVFVLSTGTSGAPTPK